MLVAKYDSTGQLDPGFATQGIFLTSLPDGRWAIHAPPPSPGIASGRLLVAGAYGPGSVLVLRLTADGQLDTTFAHGRGARRFPWAGSRSRW